MDFTDEVAVQSTFIRWLGYFFADSYQEIHVKMAAGWVYVYRVLEATYWENFKSALSKGKYYNSVLKRRFDYVRKYR